MRSPNWCIEELMLALELYLSKDKTWMSKISNSTVEVQALSYILKNLDVIKCEHDEKFRSTNSIRLKLANFQALDDRYGRPSMSNVGNLDKEIWNKYSKDYKKLREECHKIINSHLIGDKTPIVVEYLLRYERDEEQAHEDEVLDEIMGMVKKIQIAATESKDIKFAKFVTEQCFAISEKIAKSQEKIVIDDNIPQSTHAGINQQSINGGKAKIGKHVQAVMAELAQNRILFSIDVDNMKSAEWSRKVLHLGHPFLIDVDEGMESSKQRRDENGHQRYWKTVVVINDEKYYLCKEWYENQRKYFDAWVISLYVDISCDLFKEILCFIKSSDENGISIKVSDVVDKYSEGRKIIKYLVDRGVLTYFQGSEREIVVDDYELLFEMINNPAKFIRGDKWQS